MQIDVIGMSNAAREAAGWDESKTKAIFCHNLVDALSKMSGDEIARYLVSLEATPFFEESKVEAKLTFRFTYFISYDDAALSETENKPKV